MQSCKTIIKHGRPLFIRSIRKNILNKNNCWYISRSISMVTPVLNQFSNNIKVQHKFLSTIPNESEVDIVTYEKVCEETLESLADYFEEIVEKAHHLKSADVTYSSGVLTINFGNPYGTYVINRQTPNRQIWLSSPTSGPKRYDYNVEQNNWIYKHNGKSLHQLLQDEVPLIVKNEVDFSCCSHSSI